MNQFAPARRLAGLMASVLFLSACGARPASEKPFGPALVQIENSPDSRPHEGLQRADVIYEYATEGGITRFTAIYFRPSGRGRIEPVRSARPVTLKLQKAYGGVVFYSGASDRVTALIRSSGLPALDESADGGRYFARDPARPAPHNLFTTPDQLREGLGKYARRIDYTPGPKGQPPAGGEPANRVVFQQSLSHQVLYTFSATEHAYGYGTPDGPLVDVGNGGQQVKVASVVLVRVGHHSAGYRDVRGAEVIDFELEGRGPADIYAGGMHYSGTWDQSSPDRPLAILDSTGKPMPLSEGLTWIHLVDPDTQVRIS